MLDYLSAGVNGGTVLEVAAVLVPARVLLTYRNLLLAHVDRLMVMSFGQVIAQGPRDEVIANIRGNTVALATTTERPVSNVTVAA